MKLVGNGKEDPPENCTLIGMRSIDLMEKENLQQLGVTVFPMTDIDRIGIGAVIELALNTVYSRFDCLHVSFDLDALDPSVAPGVGTPVPGGLTYREAHLIMERIAETHMIASMDVAEVNPTQPGRPGIGLGFSFFASRTLLAFGHNISLRPAQ
jgi:arginase